MRLCVFKKPRPAGLGNVVFAPHSPRMHCLPLSRRDALKRVIGLSVALSALDVPAFAQLGARGIGGDPNLFKKEIPWPRVLSDAEKRTVAALADLIIPADEHGPAASAVGVPDFIDEWVSAPYEQQQGRPRVDRRGGAKALWQRICGHHGGAADRARR